MNKYTAQSIEYMDIARESSYSFTVYNDTILSGAYSRVFDYGWIMLTLIAH